MKNADAGVGIQGYFGVMFRAKGEHLFNIFRQYVDGHGGIFNEAQRLLFALESKHEAKPFFSKVPHIFVLFSFRE